AVPGGDVSGGLINGDEDTFLDAEVPFGGDLDGGGDAAKDGFPRDLSIFVKLVHEFEDRLAGILFFLVLLLDRHDASTLCQAHGPLSVGFRENANTDLGFSHAAEPGRLRRPHEWPSRTDTRHPDAAARGRCIDGSWLCQKYCDQEDGGKQEHRPELMMA